MKEFTEEGGWTTVTNQLLPARRDGLQLLSAERRHLRRRYRGQHQLRQRRGELHQAGQAVRPPRQDDAGRALQVALPAKEVGADTMQASMPPPTTGGRWRTSIPWPRSSSTSSRRSTTTTRNGAPTPPTCRSRSGPTPSSGPAPSIRPDVIKAYEAGARSSRPSARSSSAPPTTSSSAR